MQKLRNTKFLDSVESKTENFTPINAISTQFEAQNWYILRKLRDFEWNGHSSNQFLLKIASDYTSQISAMTEKLVLWLLIVSEPFYQEASIPPCLGSYLTDVLPKSGQF